MLRLRLTYLAWFAFLLSGILFIVSGIRAGDPWTVAGSVIWIAGVGLFLVALRLGNRPPR